MKSLIANATTPSATPAAGNAAMPLPSAAPRKAAQELLKPSGPVAEPVLKTFEHHAHGLVDKAVEKIAARFPTEEYPVRPPYRRTVYRRFRKLKLALRADWKKLATRSGLDRGGHDAAGQEAERMITKLLRTYGRRTQKKEVKTKA